MIRSRNRARGGGAGSFNPYALPNQYLRYDLSVTSSITQTSGAVDQMDDLTGNARHATATGTFRPLVNGAVVYNGAQVAQFNGSRVMSIANSTGLGNGNFTIYVVMQNAVSGGTQRWLIGSDGNMGLQVQNSNLRGVCGAAATFSSTGGVDTSSNIFGFIRNGATGKNLFNAVTANTVSTADNATASGLFLGGLNAATPNLIASVFEVLIYNTAHDDATATAVMAFLNNKWIVYNGLAITDVQTTDLRTAATQNRLAYSQQTQASTDRHYFNVPKQITGDLSSLAINLHNFYRTSSLETDVTTPTTFDSVYVYNDAGTIGFPIYFSGLRSVTLTAGQNDLNSDVVLPASVGQSVFTAGKWWIKGIVSFTAGDSVPLMRTLAADVANTQYGFYLASATTPSTTDAAGVFTFSGTAPTTKTQGYNPIILGTPVVDALSYICIGDSIADYNADAAANIHGDGFFQRAMGGLSAPSINVAMNGSATELFCVGVKWRQYVKYCNRAVDEIGTNDVATNATANVSYISQKIKYLWRVLKAFGAVKVLRTKLLVRTTSTDSWATTANQTVATGWTAGGNSETLSATFDASLSAGLIEKVANMNSVRDGVTPQKWAVDGTAFKYTTDGLHPSPSGHALAASDLQTDITTMA